MIINQKFCVVKLTNEMVLISACSLCHQDMKKPIQGTSQFHLQVAWLKGISDVSTSVTQ
jgi:hypothetical protein